MTADTPREALLATRQVVTAARLQQIFDQDELLKRVCIQTCDGEWRIEPDGRYRFWKNEERDD